MFGCARTVGYEIHNPPRAHCRQPRFLEDGGAIDDEACVVGNI